MPHMELKDALDALDLPAVWDLAPNPNGTPCPTRGPCVVKSPLRVDGKGASFSLDRELRIFKDHAENGIKGGVWKFVELAKPEWSKAEIAREIIRRAGGDPDAKDPNYKAKTKTALRQEKQALQEKMRSQQKRDNLRIKAVPADKLLECPKRVLKVWEKAQALAAEPSACDALAVERGWPVEWAEELVQSSKMGINSKGEPVFAVERIEEDADKVVLCGLHTRWRPEEGGKAWAYRPAFKYDGQEVAALPFFLGAVSSQVWIVAEGQWDATTAYGLLGGFEDMMQIEACCWGIRGVSGVDVFLDTYQKRIRRDKPILVLIPDADKAARRWTEDDAGKWCFMRRLKEITGAPVASLKFKKKPGMKDLNDFYKKGLDAERFAEMVRSVMGVAQAA